MHESARAVNPSTPSHSRVPVRDPRDRERSLLIHEHFT